LNLLQNNFSRAKAKLEEAITAAAILELDEVHY
jgi:hypothetical protein